MSTSLLIFIFPYFNDDDNDDGESGDDDDGVAVEMQKHKRQPTYHKTFIFNLSMDISPEYFVVITYILTP